MQHHRSSCKTQAGEEMSLCDVPLHIRDAHLQIEACHARGLHTASIHAEVTAPWQTAAAVFKEKLVTLK